MSNLPLNPKPHFESKDNSSTQPRKNFDISKVIREMKELIEENKRIEDSLPKLR